MKTYITILAALVIFTGCKKMDIEQGNAKIYLTQITGGVIAVTPANAQIDKVAKTMTYTLGISRSGLQAAEAYQVQFTVDTDNLPAGTVPLQPGDYTLTAGDDKPATQEITIPDGAVQAPLHLTIHESVFSAHPGARLALNVTISNPSKYELNPDLSAATIIIDVVNFLGNYVTVTDQYLKNTQTPFQVTSDSPPLGSCDPYQQTPTDWIVNDAVKIHQYNGKNFGGVDARCWSGRNWLSAGNYDNYTTREILNGKIYQVAELPAGNYRLEYDIAESPGGPGHAALAVSEGTELTDFDQLGTQALAWREFIGDAPRLDFKVNQLQEVAIGFVYDIPVGVQGAYAIRRIELLKQVNVFNE
jgi:hypothetical protein